jgi:hypothetical protein
VFEFSITYVLCNKKIEHSRTHWQPGIVVVFRRRVPCSSSLGAEWNDSPTIQPSGLHAMPPERAPLAGGEPNSISRITAAQPSEPCRQLWNQHVKKWDLGALGSLCSTQRAVLSPRCCGPASGRVESRDRLLALLRAVKPRTTSRHGPGVEQIIANTIGVARMESSPPIWPAPRCRINRTLRLGATDCAPAQRSRVHPCPISSVTVVIECPCIRSLQDVHLNARAPTD